MDEEHDDILPFEHDEEVKIDSKEQLNIQSEIKQPVFPQQKYLANHIVQRIRFMLDLQNQKFDQFKSVDFQVRTAISESSLPAIQKQ